MARENKTKKALLVSMPWADFQYPSLQIGCLAAYARKAGYDIEARHLHLQMASIFGLKEYDSILWAPPHTGECFFSALLFPERKNLILRHVNRQCSDCVGHFHQFSKSVLNLYKSVNWGIYDLVGFSICYEQIFASILFARWIKNEFPNIKILFGGAQTTGKLGADILRYFPEVDWCIDGEGEMPIVKVLDRISDPLRQFYHDIPGLIYRKDGLVCMNPRQQLSRLNGLPDPDYQHYFDLFQKCSVMHEDGVIPTLPIEGSRGCPHRCAFCWVHVNCDGYRARPPEEVAAQLKRMSKRYRVNKFRFVDSSIPEKCSAELSSLIEAHKCDYNLLYDIRANIKKSDLEAMRRAGVREVQIGIEAMSTRLLNKMNKGTRFMDNLQAMKFCEELDIEHISNIIVAFPTEAKTDIDESVRNIEYASAYRPPVNMINFSLYWKSAVYNSANKYGIFNIRNDLPACLLPPSMAKGLEFNSKQYDSCRKPHDYSSFKARLSRWQEDYSTAAADNRKLLCYYDLQKFLRIEDFRSRSAWLTPQRESIAAFTLEGNARELYLFCDSYKSFDEIKKRFPKWDPREIKKVLGKLVKLKVMFREDDDYLSLAIRANPRNR